MRVLITGTAGFIGFHLARRMLEDGHEVIGFDAFTPYYDPALKERRHRLLCNYPGFREERGDLTDPGALERAVGRGSLDALIHLAAQAGVRYSLENPRAYLDSNVVGTFNVLDLARRIGVPHLLFASTSSIYGIDTPVPFRETDGTDHPVSFYAATKKAAEAIAHSYSHLWRIPTTAVRFFTVYGPWGRPDMAPHRFTKGILGGTPIDLYNGGHMRRDFTYVDDLVEALVRLLGCVPPPVEGRSPPVPGDSLSLAAPFRVVNVGASQACDLLDFVAAIEAAVGRPAVRNLMPMQPGDVTQTFASADLLASLTGFRPKTSLQAGVGAFVDWYRGYYGG